MSGTWTEDELRRIGGATELRIASRRHDGSLRPYVTIWTVRAGDGLYVRSAYGMGNPWFRRATASGTGRIRAAGLNAPSPLRRPASLTRVRRRRSMPPTTPSTTATARRSSAPSPARMPHP